jgi:hypothetical protein
MRPTAAMRPSRRRPDRENSDLILRSLRPRQRKAGVSKDGQELRMSNGVLLLSRKCKNPQRSATGVTELQRSVFPNTGESQNMQVIFLALVLR